jgi:hypothetical protein
MLAAFEVEVRLAQLKRELPKADGSAPWISARRVRTEVGQTIPNAVHVSIHCVCCDVKELRSPAGGGSAFLQNEMRCRMGREAMRIRWRSLSWRR